MKKFLWISGFFSLLLILMVFFSLSTGIVNASWQDIAGIFTGTDTFNTAVLREIRLPRIILALLSGAALGISGYILQKVLHNDLAAPEIIGISSGAGCAGMILIFYLPECIHLLGIAAFCGGITAAAVVYLAAWKKGMDPVRLVLAGVAVSTLFSAFSAAVMLLNPGKVIGVFEFTLGGVAGKSLVEVKQSIPFFAASFLGAILLTRRLQILSFDDESAAALGVNVERTRLAALAVAALAAASAVSVSGLLGFAGLMAPHIARKLGAGIPGKALFLTAVIGALLTVCGEWCGRILMAPHELPAGLFLSVAGAVFFLILLLKRNGETL